MDEKHYRTKARMNYDIFSPLFGFAWFMWQKMLLETFARCKWESAGKQTLFHDLIVYFWLKSDSVCFCRTLSTITRLHTCTSRRRWKQKPLLSEYTFTIILLVFKRKYEIMIFFSININMKLLFFFHKYEIMIFFLLHKYEL